MEIKIGGKVFLVIIVLIVIGIVGFSASGYFTKNDDNLSDLDKFAKCISEKGATMYGAEWCGHCQNQKKMFGDSFKYVNYVECPDPNNQALCEQKGITGYPTWIINGLPYAGEQSFEKLSELTGCPLS